MAEPATYRIASEKKLTIMPSGVHRAGQIPTGEFTAPCEETVDTVEMRYNEVVHVLTCTSQ